MNFSPESVNHRFITYSDSLFALTIFCQTLQIFELYSTTTSIQNPFSIQKLGRIVINGIIQNFARTFFDVFLPCERFFAVTYQAGSPTSSLHFNR
jgi:hypothetical protein